MDYPTFQKKRKKLAKLRSLILPGLDYVENENNLDFLPEKLRKKYGVFNTENVSAHPYDEFAEEVLASKPSGIFLDCGCGKRPKYLENVVNYEIVNYESTDVLGVAEELPFIDNSFDGVLSLNVLEHVQNPFKCAQEISRVLKPGGKLYCVVPFMSPYHDYPDHYYNMTKSGLKNLFDRHLVIDKQEVIKSGLPIYSLTWILHSWAQGLPANTLDDFLNMKVKDLLGEPVSYLDKPFVYELPKDKNFELGATTALWAHKT